MTDQEITVFLTLHFMMFILTALFSFCSGVLLSMLGDRGND